MNGTSSNSTCGLSTRSRASSSCNPRCPVSAEDSLRTSRVDSRADLLYYLNVYRWEERNMPRVAVEDNSRMSLRIRAEEKALLMRAVALDHTDLTDFVIRHALRAAKAVIQEADHLQLS